ncbi:MAG: guanylate kinase [Ignavibacteria bacterium]|nr:guanylate kinase [Ignavibacteria bacterium]
MLIVVSAPSGAGKTSIVKEILKRHLEIVFSVSATTRPKRNDETEGRDYFFISDAEFTEKIRNKEFVEYEKLFQGHYYGTLKTFVDENLKAGKNVLFDLDVNGALSVKKIYGNNAKLIFIKPPDRKSVENRLLKRGTENEMSVKNRLERFDMEMGKINEFDYIILNDNLNHAVADTDRIIKSLINNKQKGEYENVGTNN